MSTIRAIYHPVDGLPRAPQFPASDQHPDAVRYLVSPYYVDALDGAPTLAEIRLALGLDNNSQIDAEISGIYAEKPFTPRSLTELAWAIAQIRDLEDLQVENRSRAIRALAAGQSTYIEAAGQVLDASGNHAVVNGKYAYVDGAAKSLLTFDVVRVPDLKKNQGMKDSKSAIDRTGALRSQKT